MEEIILKEDVKIISTLCSRGYKSLGVNIGVVIKIKRGDFNPEVYCDYCSDLKCRPNRDVDCLYKNLSL